MNDAEPPQDSGEPPSGGGFAYFAGGDVLGAATIVFVALTCGLAIAVLQSIFVVEACVEGFPVAVVIGTGVFTLVMTVAGGCWLARMRRWVSHSDAPDAAEGDDEVANGDRGDYLRRQFTIGSFAVYGVLTPVMWAVIIAALDCSSN